LNYYSSYLNGLLVALGLIMAIGAQNAFVLAQSLRREHHVSVALVCMTCDAILITAGVFGLAALLQQYPLAMEVTRWGGVLFLVGYSLLALRRAFADQSLVAGTAERPRRARRAVLLTTLAITLLNPHVYLDTMVLIGSIGAQQSWPVWFVAGAASASILWFFSLALGAARLAPMLQRPITWRIIDLLVAVMMLKVAWTLVSPVFA
jgi:L-lysine exporter family protein LysE/ArgO